MKLVLNPPRNVVVQIVVLVACPMARAGGERKSWKPEKAEAYLDERQKAWFAFSSADSGEGETRTSCVSCHTVLPYVLARPVLRKFVGTETATEQEKKLITQTRMRVENWTARRSVCSTIRMPGRKRSPGARRQFSTQSSSHSMTGAEVRRAMGRNRRSRTFGGHRRRPATTRGRGIGSTSTWGPGNGKRHATLEHRWLRSPSGPRLVITPLGWTQTPTPVSRCSETI